MTISKLERNFYYQEAYNGNKKLPIFLGNLTELSPYLNDVIQNGKNSKYFSCMLCPERVNDEWTYQNNLAWMMGGVKAGRNFLLVSDLDRYEDSVKTKIQHIKNNFYYEKPTKRDVYNKGETLPRGKYVLNFGVTIDELRWLYDNGYRFKVNPENPRETIAYPSGEVTNLVAKPYDGLLGGDCDNDVLTELFKIRNMLEDIARQRYNSQLNATPKATIKFDTVSTEMSMSDILNALSQESKNENLQQEATSANSAVTNDVKNSFTDVVKKPVANNNDSPFLPNEKKLCPSKSLNEIEPLRNSKLTPSKYPSSDNIPDWRSQNLGDNSSYYPTKKYSDSFFGNSRSDNNTNWRSNKNFNDSKKEPGPFNKSPADNNTNWRSNKSFDTPKKETKKPFYKV